MIKICWNCYVIKHNETELCICDKINQIFDKIKKEKKMYYRLKKDFLNGNGMTIASNSIFYMEANQEYYNNSLCGDSYTRLLAKLINNSEWFELMVKLPNGEFQKASEDIVIKEKTDFEQLKEIFQKWDKNKACLNIPISFNFNKIEINYGSSKIDFIFNSDGNLEKITSTVYREFIK